MRRLLLVVLVSTATVRQEPGERPVPPGGAETLPVSPVAVAKGRAEADAELDAGDASIWTWGTSMRLLFEHLDRETGLYYRSFGCVVDNEIVGRVKGHNARIAEHIRDHGPPANSFKPWENELFRLRDYFESRCRTAPPIRLTAGGEPAVSPDGAYSVRLVKRQNESPDGKPSESVDVVVGDDDAESRRILLLMKDPELVWGPRGSWFAVLRGGSRMGNGNDYMALDLRRGCTIRLDIRSKYFKD